MRYHDFDLAIEKGADGAIALKSWCDLHGEYRDAATLDTTALENDRNALLSDEVARTALVALGCRLYGYTFASAGRNIEWHFGQCWGAAGNAATGVRVRLRVEAPELAVIPWEYIYSERLRTFLGVSERTPIVRYLELPQAIPSLEAALPVRVLIVVPEQPELDTVTERREILAALEPLKGAVIPQVLEGKVTRRMIADTLAADEYHVFHFIGHGDFENDRAVLVMKNDAGGDEFVDQDRMAGLFRNHPSMKLVVLNSCRGGELSASKPFVGMAAELVRLGIPAVIAMQYEIVDDEAVCFARTLYRQLFTGRDRGRIEVAVSHARNALAEDFPDTRAVGLPVLFMHTREGILFNVETGSALRDLPISARSAERVKAVIRTHEHNLELIKKGQHSAELAVPGDDAGGVAVAPMRLESPELLEKAEREALNRAKRTLRFRNASIVIALAVALVTGLAATFFGFRAVHPWFRPESYFVAFSDLFHHHDREESVTFVAIDSATTLALGTPDSTWRSRHAAVVSRLVAAGAPVIAFNLTFAPKPSLRAANDSLAAAFRAARANGRTIVAAMEIAQGRPNVEPLLAPFAEWAPNCAGDLPAVTAKVLTLATRGRGGGGVGASLPLAAVAAFRGADGRDAPGRAREAATARLLDTLALDSVVAGADESRCAFAAGDTLFRMALDYAPRHEHRDPTQRISYLSALRGEPLGNLSGKLVLVGHENPGNTFRIVRGLAREERFGVELEADAMNTLLRGIRIAPLSQRGQFLVIVAMAALGALAAYLVVRFGRKGAAIALLAGLVAYFVAGAALYAQRHTLLNTFFDLSALLLAFATVIFARRVWFP